MSEKSEFVTMKSDREAALREKYCALQRDCPVPPDELINNAGLFLRRHTLARYLFLDELYRQILPVQGIIIEFGMRWGPLMPLFTNLRGIYEPYNHIRRIVGFDTFTGFPSVHEKDGEHPVLKAGAYSVSDNYDQFLQALVTLHESEAPLPHVKKFEICKGPAEEELEKYLQRNPQTIIALAYFDFDIYEPTKKCLELIKPYLCRGSVLGFDEINNPTFKGETVALREVMGLGGLRIQASRHFPVNSFAIME